MNLDKILFTLLFIFFTLSGVSSQHTRKYPDDEAAIRDLALKLKKDPNNARLLFQFGWYMQKRSFDDLAEDYYNKCLNVDPKYSPAWINLGNIYASRKKMKMAQEAFERAIEISPNSPEAYYSLGAFYLMNNDHAKAVYNFGKVVHLKPKDKEAYLNLSAIHLHFYSKKAEPQQLEIAKDYLIRASKISPTYPHIYFNLGKIFQIEGKLGTALEYFRKAVIYYDRGSPYYRKSIEIINQLKDK